MLIARIALGVHAAIALLAAVMFLTARVPHAADAPSLAHLVAAEHIAAAVLFVYVLRRLPEQRSLIIPPIAFVLSNFAVHVYELSCGDREVLPPFVIEAVFLTIYVVFLVRKPVEVG